MKAERLTDPPSTVFLNQQQQKLPRTTTPPLLSPPPHFLSPLEGGGVLLNPPRTLWLILVSQSLAPSFDSSCFTGTVDWLCGQFSRTTPAMIGSIRLRLSARSFIFYPLNHLPAPCFTFPLTVSSFLLYFLLSLVFISAISVRMSNVHLVVLLPYTS